MSKPTPIIVTEDDRYLIKLKGAGFTHASIAVKLGISEAEVEQRWKDIENAFIAGNSSGYMAICDHVTVMAHQYQLLGESLKITAEFLSNRMSEQELGQLVVKDREQTLKNLRSQCIVLRPFVPLTAEESIKKTLEGN